MMDHRSTNCNTVRLSWIVAAFLIITTSAQQPDDNTNAFGCTLCADGSAPNFDASIGATSCGAIANAISQTPANSELCTMTQLQGYIYCNCPTFPTESYCSLCSNYSTTNNDFNAEEYYYNPIPTQNRNKIIPDTNLTCGEAEFIKKATTTTNNNSTNNTSSSCSTILPDSTAEYCGCTEMTKRTCYLCNEDDTNTSMLYVNRLLPPLFTTTCGSFDRSIGLIPILSDKNECSGTNTTIGALFQSIPVPVTEYCGCYSSLNVSQPPNSCNICNGTQSVRNPDATIIINDNVNNDDDNNNNNDGVRITCAELELVTKYVTNETYCTVVSKQYETACCSESAAPTTRNNTNFSRTQSPAQSPLLNNSTAPTTTNASNMTSSSRTNDTIQSSIPTILLLMSIILLRLP
jgi:hypothetical protein